LKKPWREGEQGKEGEGVLNDTLDPKARFPSAGIEGATPQKY
jgi:hypothetical protein